MVRSGSPRRATNTFDGGLMQNFTATVERGPAAMDLASDQAGYPPEPLMGVGNP